jgi:NAD-dependent dihydropyrimidine dehydrogenase PreA subunit
VGVVSKNVYERLAQHLDKLPGGFPPSPSGVELRLLKRLFTPKEAKLAVHLTLNREEARIIARRAKLVLGEAEQRLRKMARKGLIFSIESEAAPPLYQAVPWMVGIYEFQVNNLDEGFVQDVNEYIRTKGKASRPQLIPQIRTIPIGRSIEPHLEALPYERAEELVKTHRKFAVAPCICRRKAEIAGVGCNAPKETCLMFGEWADYYVRNGMARYIDQPEVAEILTLADKANLVLQPNNSKEMVFMCCCCGCCCAVLTRIKLHPRPSELVASPFRARHDSERCKGCETCVDRCQMGALIREGDRVVLNSARCIGCGLCVSTCPTGSLTLARKTESEQIKMPINMDATWRELSQV